ncbi:MAG TPA: hypothetical protein VKI44_25445 [Acetobacteraceae bacterium]|nr:hypothetical protein [Acetobacteraceae bacterium]
MDAGIGIACTAPIGQAHQPDRQTQHQLATLRLVDNPAAQTTAQQVQLGFTHGTFGDGDILPKNSRLRF